MKSVKWLYAMFFALTFTLVAEMIGAFAAGGGIAWYNSLSLPPLSLSGTAHSAVWCVIYAAEAVLISQLLVNGKYSPFIFYYVVIKLFAAVWTVFFFTARQPILALVILTVILALNFGVMKSLFKLKLHPYKGVAFIPILLWYAYLWIQNYCIVLIN